jgi:hypothetical protein
VTVIRQAWRWGAAVAGLALGGTGCAGSGPASSGDEVTGGASATDSRTSAETSSSTEGDTATGTGSPTSPGTGTGTGTGDVASTGMGTGADTGTATGTPTDTGTGTSTLTATGSGTGTGASSDTGSAAQTATDTGSGSDTATGAGTQTPATSTDTGVTTAAERFTVSASLASDHDPAAPGTVGIVEWSTTEAGLSGASIEFGLDTSYGMTAPVDLNEPNLRTLLLGMKPEHDYHFRVVATTASGTVASDDYVVTTGPGTDLVSLGPFDVVNEAARERGFIISEIFRQGAGGGGAAVAFILDPDGEIVWWYQSQQSTLAAARMSADGKNLWLVTSGLQGAPLERVSMDTLDVQTYDVVASHDITAVSGSTMAFLEYGEPDCDSLVEIDPSGATQEIFESQDVLAGNCHSNAVRYSATEDVYTFSDLRNDVFVVDRAGNVTTRLTEIVGPNSTWGGAQHGHHLLDGSFLIFANSGGSGGGAAAIEYDPSGNELFRYAPGISTSNLGDVQRLPGGNTLVTFSTSATIHEVDPSGSPVLTIDTGGIQIGYSSWRPSLYGPPADSPL